MLAIRSTTSRGICQNAFTSPWYAINDARAMSPTRRERDPLRHRINGGDSPCDQRRMRGWSSRLLTGTVRFDSVTPLSCVERKIGSFASPSRDGFAFVVDPTVLRYFRTVKVSWITDTFLQIRESLRCDVMTGTASRCTKEAATLDRGGLVRISVLGMGYVGAVSAACLARDGHDVIGVDLDVDKLRLIERGARPLWRTAFRPDAEVVSSGRLTVSRTRRARCKLRMFLSSASERHRESMASKIRRRSCASPNRSAWVYATMIVFTLWSCAPLCVSAPSTANCVKFSNARRDDVPTSTSRCASSRSSCEKEARFATTTTRRSP